jgi:hypothetical protein
VDGARDLLFSLHEQAIEADAIVGRADVVFTAANFRTVTRGQRLCRWESNDKTERPRPRGLGQECQRGLSEMPLGRSAVPRPAYLSGPLRNA